MPDATFAEVRGGGVKGPTVYWKCMFWSDANE
jgi:hypothetical protein